MAVGSACKNRPKKVKVLMGTVQLTVESEDKVEHVDDDDGGQTWRDNSWFANHLDDKVDSDQSVVNKELSLCAAPSGTPVPRRISRSSVSAMFSSTEGYVDAARSRLVRATCVRAFGTWHTLEPLAGHWSH